MKVVKHALSSYLSNNVDLFNEALVKHIRLPVLVDKRTVKQQIKMIHPFALCFKNKAERVGFG